MDVHKEINFYYPTTIIINYIVNCNVYTTYVLTISG